jgi:hypothetical protein
MNDHLRVPRIAHSLKNRFIVFVHVMTGSVNLPMRLASFIFIPASLPASGKKVLKEFPDTALTPPVC